MPDQSYLRWPFFSDGHRSLAGGLEEWAITELTPTAAESHDEVDAMCREYVNQLGSAGWLRYVVPKASGGVHPSLDLRSLCLVRDVLARRSALAEFSFAMQGLGSAPVSLYGSEALQQRYLPQVAAGKAIAAFALSESEAGSDISAIQTTARSAENGYVLNGEKTWVSNAGIADHYVVFCRFPEQGQKSFLAVMVDANTAGLRVTGRTRVMAPHPLGAIRLEECRVERDAVIGEPGQGLKVALGTLDLFRATVGAAALGLARRAFDEALSYVQHRRAFGQPLSEFQLTKARLADMAVAIDSSALLVYRAAWEHDSGARKITREAAMAKLYATESAQRVIDDAVQLFGARGVVAGEPVERLYREVRALRIYEGTSEIQKLIIAGQLDRGLERREAQHG